MIISSLNYIQGGPIDTKVIAIQKCMEELLQIVHERRKYDKQLLKYVTQVNRLRVYISPYSIFHEIKLFFEIQLKLLNKNFFSTQKTQC